jgi:hypothetical protein
VLQKYFDGVLLRPNWVDIPPMPRVEGNPISRPSDEEKAANKLHRDAEARRLRRLREVRRRLRGPVTIRRTFR